MSRPAFFIPPERMRQGLIDAIRCTTSWPVDRWIDPASISIDKQGRYHWQILHKNDPEITESISLLHVLSKRHKISRDVGQWSAISARGDLLKLTIYYIATWMRECGAMPAEEEATHRASVAAVQGFQGNQVLASRNSNTVNTETLALDNLLHLQSAFGCGWKTTAEYLIGEVHKVNVASIGFQAMAQVPSLVRTYDDWLDSKRLKGRAGVNTPFNARERSREEVWKEQTSSIEMAERRIRGHQGEPL